MKYFCSVSESFGGVGSVRRERRNERSRKKERKMPILELLFGANNIDLEEVQPPSLYAVLWTLYKWELLGGSAIRLFSDLLNFANPAFLRYAIFNLKYIEDHYLLCLFNYCNYLI